MAVFTWVVTHCRPTWRAASPKLFDYHGHGQEGQREHEDCGPYRHRRNGEDDED
jgi:hypothetical protein